MVGYDMTQKFMMRIMLDKDIFDAMVEAKESGVKIVPLVATKEEFENFEESFKAQFPEATTEEVMVEFVKMLRERSGK